MPVREGACMNLSKLDDIVVKHLESLWENGDREGAFREVGDKLVGLGCDRVILEEEEASDLGMALSKFSLKNSDCVVYYLGHDDCGHDFFAIPRDIAERIVVLGSLP